MRREHEGGAALAVGSSGVRAEAQQSLHQGPASMVSSVEQGSAPPLVSAVDTATSACQLLGQSRLQPLLPLPSQLGKCQHRRNTVCTCGMDIAASLDCSLSCPEVPLADRLQQHMAKLLAPLAVIDELPDLFQLLRPLSHHSGGRGPLHTCAGFAGADRPRLEQQLHGFAAAALSSSRQRRAASGILGVNSGP